MNLNFESIKEEEPKRLDESMTLQDETFFLLTSTGVNTDKLKVYENGS